MTSLLFCYCTPADINFIILVDPGILYYNVYSGIRELSPTLTEIAIRKRSSSTELSKRIYGNSKSSWRLIITKTPTHFDRSFLTFTP